jgi:hypothetical protein
MSSSVALNQLLARDEEDNHYILNPQTSFFQPAFAQHTNFATQLERLNFKDVVKWGNNMSMHIPVHGDMLSKLTMEIKLPPLPSHMEWVHNLGHAMIDRVDVRIGGTSVFSVTGEYLYLIGQLESAHNKNNGMGYALGYMMSQRNDLENTIYVPLTLHFTKTYMNALPLLCFSKFQETYLDLHLKPIEQLVHNKNPILDDLSTISQPNINMLSEYVNLASWEKAFKNSKVTENMIEQVNFTECITSQRTFKVPINIKCPVKELVFMVQNLSDQNPENSIDPYKYTYGPTNKNPIKELYLNVNGSRTIKLPGSYYNLITSYYHHSNIPSNPGIMVYSFAINPEAYQPSGSINFNALGDAEIVVELEDDYYDFFPKHSSASFRMYTKTMNILKLIPNEGAMLLYL